MLLFRYRARPNELMVKKVAMLGCSLLVVAHSIRDRAGSSNTYAGKV